MQTLWNFFHICMYKRSWYIRERNVHLYKHTNTYVSLISYAQSPLLSDLKWEFAGCFAAAEVGRYSMPLNADQRLLAICRRIFVLSILPRTSVSLSFFPFRSHHGVQEYSWFSIIFLDQNFAIIDILKIFKLQTIPWIIWHVI